MLYAQFSVFLCFICSFSQSAQIIPVSEGGTKLDFDQYNEITIDVTINTGDIL